MRSDALARFRAVACQQERVASAGLRSQRPSADWVRSLSTTTGTGAGYSKSRRLRSISALASTRVILTVTSASWSGTLGRVSGATDRGTARRHPSRCRNDGSCAVRPTRCDPSPCQARLAEQGWSNRQRIEACHVLFRIPAFDVDLVGLDEHRGTFVLSTLHVQRHL